MFAAAHRTHVDVDRGAGVAASMVDQGGRDGTAGVVCAAWGVGWWEAGFVVVGMGGAT